MSIRNGDYIFRPERYISTILLTVKDRVYLNHLVESSTTLDGNISTFWFLMSIRKRCYIHGQRGIFQPFCSRSRTTPTGKIITIGLWYTKIITIGLWYTKGISYLRPEGYIKQFAQSATLSGNRITIWSLMSIRKGNYIYLSREVYFNLFVHSQVPDVFQPFCSQLSTRYDISQQFCSQSIALIGNTITIWPLMSKPKGDYIYGQRGILTILFTVKYHADP